MLTRTFAFCRKLIKRILRVSFDIFFLLFSKTILRIADVIWLQPFLTQLARDFIHRARGFSYDFSRNGEEELIQRIAAKFDHVTFFDVGANVGDYSAKLIEFCGDSAVGHLFDLDSQLNTGLSQRFSDSNIYVNHFGLSNQNEHLGFSYFPDFPAVNSLLSVEFSHLRKESSQAEVRTGDSYCQEMGIERINFLKIDVEGWERFTLEGFNEMLSENRIDLLTWEYGYTTAETHWTTRDFYSFFQEKGYVCGVIRRKGVDFRNWDYDLNDYTSGPNYFACLPSYKDSFADFAD
jgi:FkbM family methyltransferase